MSWIENEAPEDERRMATAAQNEADDNLCEQDLFVHSHLLGDEDNAGMPETVLDCTVDEHTIACHEDGVLPVELWEKVKFVPSLQPVGLGHLDGPES